MASVGEAVPPLLERVDELRAIALALGRARGGAGSLVVVEGPAGIGKTRLLAVACASAEAEGLVVLRARGGPLERDLAYGAVRQLLERPLAALDEAGRAQALAGAAALAAPALAGPGLGQERPPERLAVDHGLFWCIANLAERHPLVVVVDDAQWLDPPSLRFVHYLARRVADLPVALLAGVRAGEPGAEAKVAEQLALEVDAVVLRPAPLSAAATATLLSGRLAGTVDAEFAESCHELTRGNPFLLSELAGALAADGVRPTAASAARVRRVRPQALSHAILARLSRMPPGAMDVAAAVAVLGGGARIDLVRALTGLDDATLTAALDQLAAAEVLAPTVPVDFAHPIVGTVVYDALGPATRAGWHARAATLLMERGHAAEDAAPHLLWTTPRGNHVTVTALRCAARGARARGASDIAARYLRRAALEPPQPDEHADVLMELAAAIFLSGEELDEMRTHARAALAGIRDRAARAELWLLLSRAAVALHAGSPAALEHARSLAELGAALRRGGYRSEARSRARTPNATTLRTDKRGRFSITLPAPPANQLIAVYRLRTTSGGRTYTLPLVLRAR